MVVAPELFQPDKARSALLNVELNLLGTYGLRTLDPHDWQFRPNYLNGAESEDYATSRGFNYHQVHCCQYLQTII
eukprot:m.189995 g.189995  ORF g.189995 m.189995 type:complete len:75 (-) comp15634_c1_seq6:342-566(-)